MRSIGRAYDAIVAVGGAYHVFQDDEVFVFDPGVKTPEGWIVVRPGKIKDHDLWGALETFGPRNVDAVWADDDGAFCVSWGDQFVSFPAGTTPVGKESFAERWGLVYADAAPWTHVFDPRLGLDAFTRRTAGDEDRYYMFQDDEYVTFPVHRDTMDLLPVTGTKINAPDSEWKGLSLFGSADVETVCELRSAGRTTGYLVTQRDQILELDANGAYREHTRMPILKRWPLRVPAPAP
ncbi:hypothetical protein [Streptomyces sp. URMC 129]|uniref:hypothetical protein n=1 Tax=Streptomyces sp. URMC 129 TaxID=3423407 RepID=UPI003F1C68CD